MAEIVVAKSAGFCFGVKRAVDMAVAEGACGACLTIGPIVHNKAVAESLQRQGVGSIADWRDAPEETLIIPSHGLPRDDWQALSARDAKTVDATCPCVASMHRLAEQCEQEGRLLIIVGSKKHTEVKGLAGWCKGSIVVEDERELAERLQQLAPDTPIGMMVQTTTIRKKWQACEKTLKNHCTNSKVFDTICRATDARQSEAAALATSCDAMVVVGDRASANTEKLVKLCRMSCDAVVWVENAAQWPRGCVKNAKRIGLTAGASTPSWQIEEVIAAMTEEIKQTTMTGDESFESLLEQSFKTLNTGDRVNAYVVAITPTEIQLDLGTKHAGYIPVDELTDDPSLKPEDIVKVGGEVEVFVVRVNDQDGVVMCSKKKIDAIKHYDELEKMVDDNVMVEGIVTEENKGGVVVSVKGVRVFVPASQTGVPRETPLSTILKQKVKLYITEFNRGRRRIVGSIRAASGDSRRAASAKIWETLAVGDSFDGIVKSMTTYGAFVDIGGVDGMVHISELSWGRVNKPEDVVKIGDALKVRVIKLDPEKKKISLSAKDPSQNPWNKFVSEFKVGDVAQVKIAKFMPFGAFAEIVPGVDGLIHISEVAYEHVARLADVLTEGQVVGARIINIDDEKHKVSLSIKATLERNPQEVAQGEDEVVASADAPVQVLDSAEEDVADTAAVHEDADITVEDGDGVTEVGDTEE